MPKTITLLLGALLLFACGDGGVEGPEFYPLAEGRTWIYLEAQVDDQGEHLAKHQVQAQRAGPTVSLAGESFAHSWELTVSSNDIEVSRQRLTVDGDTVKMLSIRTGNSGRLIHFDPWFPEWLPLDAGASPFRFSYLTSVTDSAGLPMGNPVRIDLEIFRPPSDSLPVTPGAGQQVLEYYYPASGNRTYMYFAPDSGKVREESPWLNLQARSFRSSYQLKQFIP